MKAYEKWVEQNMYDRTETEKAWKAALECIKGKIDYAAAGNDMVDWIFEEELDAKTKKR